MSLDFLLLHSCPLQWKGHLFLVLFLEGLVGLLKTIQLQLFQHYWLRHRLDLLRYWMVCLGNEQRSVISETAPKYYTLDSFVNYGDYSWDAVAGKGFILRWRGNHVGFLELRRDSRVTTGNSHEVSFPGWIQLSPVWLFATPWIVAYQTPLSMGFSRQEYWSGLPFPYPGDLPNPGIKPGSPALQTDVLPAEPPGKPACSTVSCKFGVLVGEDEHASFYSAILESTHLSFV